MAVKYFACIAFVAVTLIQTTWGYGSGAPESEGICQDMTPKHGVDPQSSESPYKLSLDKTDVKPGEEVKLTLSGGTFKGFLVQGRKIDAETPIGKFAAVANTGESKALNCGKVSASTLTHTNNNDKTSLTFTWVAPDQPGTYQFVVTVVKDGYTFWVGQKSPSINVV